MAGRCGNLCFTMQSERGQRNSTRTLGVVNIPDNDHFSYDMHKKLAKWICQDDVCVLTCMFGKGNEAGIARTAVAAGASIDHIICTRFKLVGCRTHVKMPGGFIVFAPYNRLFEQYTNLNAGELDDFGPNSFVRRQLGRGILAVLLSDTAGAPTRDWSIDPGNEHCPNLWDSKMKSICWNNHVPCCVQTRVWLGSARMRERNRTKRWGHALKRKKHRSCGRAPLVGERQQLQHTPAWKNMVLEKRTALAAQRSRAKDIEDSRAVQTWEQRINALPKRAHEEIQKDDQQETAVAAAAKRYRMRCAEPK